MTTKTLKNGITVRKYQNDLINGKAASSDIKIEIPNLIEHQRLSWDDFVAQGLSEVLQEVNPIDDYTGQKLALTISNPQFEAPKKTAIEARDRNLTYEAPLFMNLLLTNIATGEVIKEDSHFYIGDFPVMTEDGTFIVNGIERVVVSQLIRSPGVLISWVYNVNKKKSNASAKIIPTRGAWIEIEISKEPRRSKKGEDAKAKELNVIYVSIDKKRRVPMTTFLRALGIGTDGELLSIFENVEDVENSGRYIKDTIEKEKNTPNYTANTNGALSEIYRKIHPGDQFTIEGAKNMIERMFFDIKRYDMGKVGRYKLNQRLGLDIDNTVENRVLMLEDLIAVIKETIRLDNEAIESDDVDSLKNRRVRTVGEIVAQQFRVGFARVGRNVRDRMAQIDTESVTLGQLFNPRPIVATVRDFFLTSQLSQFMEQVNPVAELAQKRHLTAVGPNGGLNKENLRSQYDVRDVHKTQYSRICMIETPEGGNIGIVLNLASHARINEYGFIESPYLKVEKGKITGEIIYLDAGQEESEVIADYSNKIKDGKFVEKAVSARDRLDAKMVDAKDVTYLDASNFQTIGSTASLIPFVERNKIGRTLMGANMQRQAVPLIKTESPIIGTGIEHIIAKNSGQLITAEKAGEVIKADADEVQIKYGPKEVKSYKPVHFMRSNDSGCYNQKVVVKRGDKVNKEQPIIEGTSIKDGEIALGRDVMVAFMPWRGYNMDDSVIISRRLIEDDELTSVHIDVETVEIRETKLGDEIVTRDIPNARDEALRHLDEDGIVVVGSEVEAGDVLVGKITPKGEQDLSSEERLLRAIFGEKAKDVRDTSMRVGYGQGGRVIAVKIFNRASGDEMRPGVLQQVQIYIAQIRKVEVGDKLAGRYGNKGVVAKVLPVEDMPFMEDGTPVDMILNPLGVPSRSNLGQLFEAHLGAAARVLGYKIASPSFEGIDNKVIGDQLEKAGFARDGKVQLYDGATGEPFQELTTVGSMYMLKLHHMVIDKIHARSTGPYAMVTQQPLGGKAHNGGQRLGEMEVWALEAYGVANILQEMLTVKSDDVVGRDRTYQSIIHNQEIELSSMPEMFNVLRRQLQGLGLKVNLIEDKEEFDAEYAADKIRETEIETQSRDVREAVSRDVNAETVLDESDNIGDLDGDGVSIVDADDTRDANNDESAPDTTEDFEEEEM